MKDELSEQREFMKYLRDSGYEQAFIYLALTQQHLDFRKFLLDEIVHTIRQRMKIPTSAKQEDLSRTVKEIHALQYDLIAKTFVLIEDLIYFYDVLSDDPKKLPSQMVNTKKIKTREVVDEWKKLGIRKIRNIFKFPKISDIKTSKEERVLVKQILRRQAKLVQNKLKKISKFWMNYIDIYNVYKHGLTAMTGTFSVVEGKLLSLFFVRRMCKVRGKNKVCTYHVPVNPSTVAYLQKIATDAHSLLKLLVHSIILFIRNKEGFFVLPIWRDELSLTGKEKEFLDRILKKLSFKAIPKQFGIEIQIHPKRQEIITKAFARKHIYRNCSFDIFSKRPKYVIS